MQTALHEAKQDLAIGFDGVGPDAADDELLAIADRHPVFRIDLLR